MKNPFFVGSLIIVLSALPAFSQGPVIDHEPATCVAAEGYPRFSAEISGDVAIPPKFYFRCDPVSDEFYYVEMSLVSATATGGTYEAILPTPLQPPCENIVYYLEAVDSQYYPSSTEEASPGVTRGRCEEDRLPAGGPPPTITVFGAGGVQVAAVPGFASRAIVPIVTGGLGSTGSSILGNPLFWGLVGASALTATVVIATTGEEDVSPIVP